MTAAKGFPSKGFYQVETFTGCKSIGYLVRRLHTLVLPHAEALFADAELSFSQWVILMAVRDGKANTCADIARHMNHDTGAITRLVDQMEKRGLIARARSTTDRRIVHLKLLPPGKAMAKALTPRIVDFWNHILADVPTADVNKLVALLMDLNERLEVAPLRQTAPKTRKRKVAA